MKTMFIKYALFAGVAILAISALSASPGYSDTVTGSFSILNYNVNGIPEEWTGDKKQPDIHSPMISPLLNDWDIVLLQENWNYKSDINGDTTFPYKSDWDPEKMTVLNSVFDDVGSGLRRYSQYWFPWHKQVTWDNCYGSFDWTTFDVSNGGDCQANKGFSFARHYLTDKITVDIYNFHPDSGSSDEDDLKAKDKNYVQMLEKIESASAGQAVILVGDYNSLYHWTGNPRNDGEPSVKRLNDAGFTDAYLELYEDNVVPTDHDTNGREKFHYRSSNLVTLSPEFFEKFDDVFVHETDVCDGYDYGGTHGLSDHDPSTAVFAYSSDYDFPRFSLKSAHNKYVRAKSGGGSGVVNDRTSAGSHEKFILLNDDSDPLVIKSGDTVTIRTANGYFFNETSNNLKAENKGEAASTKFTLINHTDATGDIESGDKISLLSNDNNKYVRAKSGGGVVIDRTSAGSHEKFTVMFY